MGVDDRGAVRRRKFAAARCNNITFLAKSHSDGSVDLAMKARAVDDSKNFGAEILFLVELGSSTLDILLHEQ